METVLHAPPWHQYSLSAEHNPATPAHNAYFKGCGSHNFCTAHHNWLQQCKRLLPQTSACCQVMHMDPHEFTELEKVEPPDGVPEASTSQPSASTGDANVSYTCFLYLLILQRTLGQVHLATRASLRFSCVTIHLCMSSLCFCTF